MCVCSCQHSKSKEAYRVQTKGVLGSRFCAFAKFGEEFPVENDSTVAHGPSCFLLQCFKQYSRQIEKATEESYPKLRGFGGSGLQVFFCNLSCKPLDGEEHSPEEMSS